MMKKKIEFSKILLIQESVLIWIMTIALIALAYLCILNDFEGSLPWITAMVSLPWAAYAVSQSMYYNKAKKENTAGGIKYESAMQELQQEIIEKNMYFDSLYSKDDCGCPPDPCADEYLI